MDMGSTIKVAPLCSFCDRRLHLTVPFSMTITHDPYSVSMDMDTDAMMQAIRAHALGTHADLM